METLTIVATKGSVQVAREILETLISSPLAESPVETFDSIDSACASLEMRNAQISNRNSRFPKLRNLFKLKTVFKHNVHWTSANVRSLLQEVSVARYLSQFRIEFSRPLFLSAFSLNFFRSARFDIELILKFVKLSTEEATLDFQSLDEARVRIKLKCLVLNCFGDSCH